MDSHPLLLVFHPLVVLYLLSISRGPSFAIVFAGAGQHCHSMRTGLLVRFQPRHESSTHPYLLPPCLAADLGPQFSFLRLVLRAWPIFSLSRATMEAPPGAFSSSRSTLGRQRSVCFAGYPSPVQMARQPYHWAVRPNLSNISLVRRILLRMLGGPVSGGCMPLSSRA